jgi:RNase adapter protein RapZ
MRRLVIVTGLSGAGKSQAMKSLEDFGFACLDNAPPVLARPFIALAEEAGYSNAALALDVRTLGPFGDAVAALDELEAAGLRAEVLFLDAEDETLLNRYKETRRRHPLAPGSSIAEGIAAERAQLDALKAHADVVIDTTGLSAAMLRGKIVEAFLSQQSATKLAITFSSFGFKYGPPRDADLLFDVRFLPNPHYEPELRPLTGRDQRIVDFIDRDGKLAEFYALLEPLLDYLFGQYVAEGKSYLLVAIGCTGGRHRSVAIAEHLAARYGARGDVMVTVNHRDADKPAQDQ